MYSSWPQFDQFYFGLLTLTRQTSFDHSFDQFQRCNARNYRNYRGKNALKSVKIGLKRAFTKQNKVILLFGTSMPSVRIRPLRPYRVFVTKFNYEHSFTLLLIFCLVLKFESLDTAEVFSLSFSALELVMSFIELTGGMNMDANIVVGIGCYGGRPGNRVIAIKRKPYQIKIWR